MKNDFQEIQKRALEIRKKYETIEPKKWGVDQVFMGMVKDVGDLSKILMNQEGYRNDLTDDVRDSLKHELSDILWSLLVIADKTNIDLGESFKETMNEIEGRFKK